MITVESRVLRERKMDNNNGVEGTALIPAFYRGRSVFITGGTGFVGKVLIEKLLRSCPDIEEIFVLVRPKKQQSIDDRLRTVFRNELFDKLRSERPSAFDKVIPVTGDVAMEGLGLPPVERQVLIERVSIIFHVAASVRFDDSLKEAMFTNTRSTRDVCILAGCMKKLVALVHVSSTYTQTDKREVDETLYPAIGDWKKSIKVTETLDDHTLRILSAKYLGTMRNTYIFTKRLAEQVISDYSNVLPCVIARPSIVVSTLYEPIPGWIDNFNGPVGMLVGGGKGILRVMLVDPDVKLDFMPVDGVVKALIISAWKRGMKTVTVDPTPHVYNLASANLKRITVEGLITVGLQSTEHIPLDNILWHPGTLKISSKTFYYVLMLLLHLLPAMILDGFLKISGIRPMLVKIQRKIYISNNHLSFFLQNEWNFRNEKLLDLLRDLSPADNETFGFPYFLFDIYDYFADCLVGAKRYLLHEDMSKLSEAKRHYERMRWIDRLFKIIIVALLGWILYSRGTGSYILDKIQGTAYTVSLDAQ